MTSRPRQRRGVFRGVPGWTSLAGAVALSGVFLLLLITGLLGVRGTVVLDDYASMIAPALAGVACLWSRHQPDRRSRLAWSLLGASLLSWAVGGLAWTVYEVHLGREVPFPSLADVGYLASVPLAVAGLLCFPGTRLVGFARLRPLLDGAIAAGSLLFVIWALVLGPAFHASAGSLLSQAISLAYPAADVLTATIGLLTLARARGSQRTTMMLVASGLLLVAVADSSFTWFTVRGAYATGNLFDTGYFAGYLLIGVAALRPRPSIAARTATATHGSGAVGLAPGRLAMTLPYAPLLIGVVLAVVLQLRGHPVGPFEFSICLFVIATVLLRQLLSMQMIVALGGQLHDTVAALRQREVELHNTVAALRRREKDLDTTVVALREREAELHFQAFHDPLTGLANRALFADRISHALVRTRRPDPVFLLLADLDDFKTVNDTLGHPAGDALLVAVAERLLAVVRPEDTVARLGGDEFAVLLEAADDLAGAKGVADRIAQVLLQPFLLAGVHTVIGASIGIAAADDTASGKAMLRDADIAMYAAKAQGKGRCAVYAAELTTANVGRLQLHSDLNQAMARGELSLKYLPVVDLISGRMTGVEALLRWNHPIHGSVPRESLIPLAESAGAIVPIGRWVLAQACAQVGRWRGQYPESAATLELAVNVSGRQLGNSQLVGAVEAALLAADLPPELLTLEITESVLLDGDAALEPLRALRALGVHLAVDDFGTGHSALSRLRTYPVDTLKIDQSFVRALDADSTTPDVLIGAILALGHGLNMTVIAEGVETDQQLSALRALGCHLAQGFLFARPAEPEAIAQLLLADIGLTDSVRAAEVASGGASGPDTDGPGRG